MPASTPEWCVYIIETDDGLLYTGITTDLVRRWRAHRELKSGARFFRGRQPRRLRFLESGHDRASASRREAAIKRLKRSAKWQLIETSPPPPAEWVANEPS